MIFCWLFHKLGKWVDVNMVSEKGKKLFGQTRYCETCNKKFNRTIKL